MEMRPKEETMLSFSAVPNFSNWVMKILIGMVVTGMDVPTDYSIPYLLLNILSSQGSDLESPWPLKLDKQMAEDHCSFPLDGKLASCWATMFQISRMIFQSLCLLGVHLQSSCRLFYLGLRLDLGVRKSYPRPLGNKKEKERDHTMSTRVMTLLRERVRMRDELVLGQFQRLWRKE
ncbi:hypothetical protein VNO77_23917 [Canavalia gladiata]|uniref:Uncharacterized protein n=1 Tax=Canavalia gladiata TaxID=3824 RepID=A0AAN9L593_CANGL